MTETGRGGYERTSSAPAVTVTMPVYNGARYVAGAIESVLGQTFQDLELLIVDDGSTDESPAIIQRFADDRIRVLRNERNLGLVATRNRAVEHARGAYVAILDCDDIARPTRLAEQVAFLESHPDFGMIGSWIEITGEDGRPTGEVVRYTAPAEEIPIRLLFSNYFAQSAMLIRRNVLGDEPYRSRPGAEDYDLWVRIAGKTKVWNLQKALVQYRVHASSITFTNRSDIEGYVGGIVGDQLRALGLEPTPDELELHQRIGLDAFPSDPDFLGLAEAWLVRLVRGNERERVYAPRDFGAFVGSKWFHLCSRASGTGMAAWRAFRKSPLRGLAPASAFSQAKFLLRCGLRWSVP